MGRERSFFFLLDHTCCVLALQSAAAWMLAAVKPWLGQVDDVSPEKWRPCKDANQLGGVSSRSLSSGSPSLSLALLTQGPARPKHPDGERLFPYQSGNTAPPPHPLYKKHDSSIHHHRPPPPFKKMQEDQPDSRICQKPLNSFYRKKRGKNSREQRGWGG